MTNLTKIFVGVDVSKDTLAVHILPLGESLVVQNNAHGIRDLLDKLASHTVDQVVCEASGGYETYMIKALRKGGYKIWCVEPKRIKHFIRGEGIRCKTDRIDARMIALFANKMKDKHEQKYEHNEELRILIRRKQDLSAMLSQEKTRFAHPQESCKKEIKKHILFMQGQMKSLDAKISKLAANDKVLNKKADILDSMPGVGKNSAFVLLSELPELGNVSDKAIAALVGVAPYSCESGLYKGKSITSCGRDVPRKALFMVALVAVRFNKKFKTVYEQHLNAGKAKMVALVAIMRRILVVLNAMVRNETLWNENII